MAVVGSRYPFRDPQRRPDDQASGNRIDRPRDQAQGNRRPRSERPRDEGNEAAAPPAAAPLDLSTLSDQVESLVQLITATDVTELQVESGPVKILIRRGVLAPVAPSAVPAPVAAAPPPAAAPAPPSVAPVQGAATPSPLPAVPGHNPPAPATPGPGEVVVTSPMVGTFYASPAPQEPPYVVEGDEVQPGQVIGIVEAMKMMNQIEAEIAGRVVRILVRDGQGVEYGLPLMVIAEG